MANLTTETTVVKKRGRPPGTTNQPKAKRKYTKRAKPTITIDVQQEVTFAELFEELEFLASQVEAVTNQLRGAWRVAKFNAN